MKKPNFHPTYLQVIYFIIYGFLFSFIIFTPTLISGPLHVNGKMIAAEETIEGSLLGILFIISVLILNLYKREVAKHQEINKLISAHKTKVESRLTDSYQYIGLLNVQLQEIKSIFNSIDKYPETKEDLKKTFHFFGERVHGIVKTDWVLFRIISRNTHRTISEHFETREGIPLSFPHVSNKSIIEQHSDLQFTSVVSNPQNINIRVFCVIPVEKISQDQRIFIQAIINEITKLFIILNSTYYKKENSLFVENQPVISVQQRQA